MSKNRIKYAESSLSFKSDLSFKNKNKFIFALSLFILFLALTLVSGLRAENVGTDSVVYCDAFSNTTWDHGDFIKNEPLFHIITCLVKTFTNDRNIYILVISALISLLFVINIAKSDNPLLFAVLYFNMGFFFMSLNIWRQSIAMLLLLFTLLRNQKYDLQSFLLNVPLYLCSILIHRSSLFIVVCITFAYILQINSKKLIFILPLVIYLLIVVNQNFIIQLIKNLFPNYAPYVDESLKGFGSSKNLINIIYLGIVAFTPHNEKDKKFYVAQNLFSINVILEAFHFIPILYRINAYFTLINLGFFPYILAKIENKKFRYLAIVFLLFISFISLINIILKNNHGIFPYKIHQNWII